MILSTYLSASYVSIKFNGRNDLGVIGHLPRRQRRKFPSRFVTATFGIGKSSQVFRFFLFLHILVYSSERGKLALPLSLLHVSAICGCGGQGFVGLSVGLQVFEPELFD